MNEALFNILTWGIIVASVLYFVVALVRKKSRPKAERALGEMAQSIARLMSVYLKWMVVWVILVVVMTIGLIVILKK